MKISVVVPSYNQGQFLPATLQSVLQQDYDDRELLVFDGASTDESVSILERHADELFFISAADDGQADAINQGLQKATGDILAYLNSDDIYYPHTFSRVVRYFEAHNDCDALYGDAWHLAENGSIIRSYHTEPWN